MEWLNGKQPLQVESHMWVGNRVFLGSSAPYGRIDMVVEQNDDLMLVPLVTLCKSQSIVSLVLSSCSSVLAAGTSDGEILLLDQFESMGVEKPNRVKRGYHRPGIQHLLFLSNELLFSISTEGCCRFWDIRNMEYLESMEMQSMPQSLCTAWNGQPVMFTSDGQLILWELNDNTLLPQKRIQSVCENIQSTSIHYWQFHNHLITPSDDKTLALWNYDLQQTGILTVPNAPVSSIGFLDTYLVTCGNRNGSVCIWEKETRNPIMIQDLNDTFQSCTSFGFEKTLLAGVTNSGQAKFYHYDGSEFIPVREFSEIYYSVVAGPTVESLRRDRQQRKKWIVERLQKQASKFIQHHEFANSEKTIQEIERLECVHTALALRAEQAEQKREYLEALRSLRALCQQFPLRSTKPSVWERKLFTYLQRYCLEESNRNIQARVDQLHSQKWNDTDSQEIPVSHPRRILFEGTNTGISYQECIKAARVVEAWPCHLHIYESFATAYYPGNPFSLIDLLTTYSLERENLNDPEILNFIIETVHWKNNRTTRELDVLLTTESSKNQELIMGIGIRIENEGTQFQIQPFLYLDFLRLPREDDVLLEELETIITNHMQKFQRQTMKTLKVFEMSIRNLLTKENSIAKDQR